MKKLLFVLYILGVYKASTAQNTFPTPSGNVGIGTISPGSILEVNASVPILSVNGTTLNAYRGIEYQHSGEALAKTSFNANNGEFRTEVGKAAFGGYQTFYTDLSERMRITSVGNVGVGIANPISPLHVSGGGEMTSGWNKTFILQDTYPVQIFNSNAIKRAGIGYDFTSAMRFWVNAPSDDITGTGMLAMSILNNGNIGIGTSNPQGYKLAVAGDMIAESVKVKLQSAWPDYVFSKLYTLPDLKEVEQHIADKGHLSDIPSAHDIGKEGINLGEMDAKLLRKIEELTLYLIELHKENKEQGQMIRELKEEIQELKSKP